MRRLTVPTVGTCRLGSVLSAQSHNSPHRSVARLIPPRVAAGAWQHLEGWRARKYDRSMFWLLIIVVACVLVGFVLVVGVRRESTGARASQRRRVHR